LIVSLRNSNRYRKGQHGEEKIVKNDHIEPLPSLFLADDTSSISYYSYFSSIQNVLIPSYAWDLPPASMVSLLLQPFMIPPLNLLLLDWQEIRETLSVLPFLAQPIVPQTLQIIFIVYQP